MSKNIGSLILIFIIGSIVILSNVYFHADGYLSPDSTRYLALAQNLLEGHGLTVSSVSLDGKDRDHFAIWPVGYPILIFLIAKLTGLTVFLSSKLLTLFFLAASIGLLSKLFKKDAYLFASVLLFGAYLQLFSYSWSEIPFIWGMLWLCYSIEKYLHTEKSKSALIQLLLSAIFLFLIRYIGAFSLIVLGCLALWQLKLKHWSRFRELAAIIAIAALFIVSYLYYNFVETGFITGKERLPAVESNMQLLIMVMKGFFNEVVVVIGLDKSAFFGLLVIQVITIIFVWVSVGLYKGEHNEVAYDDKNKVVESNNSSLAKIFFFVASLYYASIVLSRLNSQFDYLNFRLLSPATLLFLFGILLEVQSKGSIILNHRVKAIVFSLAFVSISFQGYRTIASIVLTESTADYFSKLKQIESHYEGIKGDEIVIFANNHLRYLNTGVIIARPDFMPFARNNESVEQFLSRLRTIYPDKDIYIDLSQKLFRCERMEPSWCELFKANSEHKFFKVQEGLTLPD